MQAFLTEKVVVPSAPPRIYASPHRRLKSFLPFGFALAVPVSIILSFVGMKSAVLAYGTEVIVPTSVVDPYDICRGSYLALSYAAPDLDTIKGHTVYVTYSNTNGEYSAVKSSETKPTVNGSDFFLKGEKKQYDNAFVTYPFSRAYFGKEGHEKLASANWVDTKLRVDKSTGEAVMVSMVVDTKKRATSSN